MGVVGAVVDLAGVSEKCRLAEVDARQQRIDPFEKMMIPDDNLRMKALDCRTKQYAGIGLELVSDCSLSTYCFCFEYPLIESAKAQRRSETTGAHNLRVVQEPAAQFTAKSSGLK